MGSRGDDCAGAQNEDTSSNDESDCVENDEIHFEPLIHLPEIEIKTLEEDEDILWKSRAKIFRFISERDEQYETGPQWKVRGVGEVKFLRHKTNGYVRLLMRRDKTLSLCANHYILPNMKLVPHKTSSKSWMWTTVADFSENEAKPEVLAIRFKDDETWTEFESEFDKAKNIMRKYQAKFESIFEQNDKNENSFENRQADDQRGLLKDGDNLAKNLSHLNVK